MKATELIAQIQGVVDEHGDLNIFAENCFIEVVGSYEIGKVRAVKKIENSQPCEGEKGPAILLCPY